MQTLEGENRQPRQANEIPRKASAYLAILAGSAASCAMPERLDRRSK